MITKIIFILFTCTILLGCTGKPKQQKEKLATDSSKETTKMSPENTAQTQADFKATGNEPFWNLEIDFDRMIHFNTMDGLELNTPVPEPDIAQDVRVVRYRAVTEAGELIVQIIPDSCVDTMSDKRSPYKVKVDIKLGDQTDYESYQGCGSYLLDQRLHNIWALTELDGDSVSNDDFSRGVPTLEIHAAEGRIAGHDGCNRLFGDIIGNQDSFRFGTLGSTMMACPEMESSVRFMELITGQAFDYAFQQGQLVLTQEGKVRLKFKNVD